MLRIRMSEGRGDEDCDEESEEDGDEGSAMMTVVSRWHGVSARDSHREMVKRLCHVSAFTYFVDS